MKPIIYLILGLITLSLLTGCEIYHAYYDIRLKEVSQPLNAKIRYGEHAIVTAQIDAASQQFSEDKLVKIIWIPNSKAVNFVITNKTDNSVKIIWDKAAYVNFDGTRLKVVHSGVRFSDINDPLPPTVIDSNGSILDKVLPITKCFPPTDLTSSNWEEMPLFPTSAITIDRLNDQTKRYKGKTFQVVLPLQVEDAIYDYVFTFNINNIEIR